MAYTRVLINSSILEHCAKRTAVCLQSYLGQYSDYLKLIDDFLAEQEKEKLQATHREAHAKARAANAGNGSMANGSQGSTSSSNGTKKVCLFICCEQGKWYGHTD
jgi:hypothetical protein